MLCEKNRRCNNIFTCKYCGEIWRRKNFRAFAEGIEELEIKEVYYYVIKPSVFDSLKNNLERIYKLIEQIRLKKKMGKLKFFGRLEVSFSSQYGFLPHLNIITFNAKLDINYNKKRLKMWKKKLKDKEETKKVAWYFLKQQKLDEEKANIVKKALKKRRQVIVSSNFKIKDYTEEIILKELDFRFLGTQTIRVREELELRARIREERRKINRKFKEELKKIRSKYGLL